MLFSPPSTPHLSFLHWFADSAEMKNTLVCSNKRKARQLCEILGHRGSEKWTIWGQSVLCCGWHFWSWSLLSMSGITLTVCCKQNPSLPAGLSRLIITNASTPNTHSIWRHSHTAQAHMPIRSHENICIVMCLQYTWMHLHMQVHILCTVLPTSPEHKCFLLHFNEEHSGRTGWDSTHSAKIFENMVLFTSMSLFLSLCSRLLALLGLWLSYEKTAFLSSYISSKSTYSALFGGGKRSV